MLASSPPSIKPFLIFCALYMKQLVKTILIVCFTLNFLSVKAQKVSGHWYGIGMLQTTKEYQNYLSELVLEQKGKSVTGFLNYYFRDSLVKVSIKGNYDATNNRLTLLPFPMIYFLSPNAKNSIDCMLSGNFTLLSSKTSSVLNGKLFADADHQYTVPPIQLKLTKSNDTATLVMVDEPEELIKETAVPSTISSEPAVVAAVAPIALIELRDKTVVKEIEVVNTKLRIELYDNGEIDYDSVTLYLNKKEILPKTIINHRAVKINIQLDETLDYNDLSMFANNLGMIPPNTAALILYDDKKRHEIILTSDLNKSATLRIRVKK